MLSGYWYALNCCFWADKKDILCNDCKSHFPSLVVPSKKEKRNIVTIKEDKCNGHFTGVSQNDGMPKTSTDSLFPIAVPAVTSTVPDLRTSVTLPKPSIITKPDGFKIKNEELFWIPEKKK